MQRGTINQKKKKKRERESNRKDWKKGSQILTAQLLAVIFCVIFGFFLYITGQNSAIQQFSPSKPNCKPATRCCSVQIREPFNPPLSLPQTFPCHVSQSHIWQLMLHKAACKTFNMLKWGKSVESSLTHPHCCNTSSSQFSWTHCTYWPEGTEVIILHHRLLWGKEQTFQECTAVVGPSWKCVDKRVISFLRSSSVWLCVNQETILLRDLTAC